MHFVDIGTSLCRKKLYSFISSSKVSKVYFSVAILTYAMLTLALFMLTLIC